MHLKAIRMVRRHEVVEALLAGRQNSQRKGLKEEANGEYNI